jgi:hypothetical protein
MSTLAAQLNGTLPLSADAWSGFLAQAKQHVSALDSRTFVLLLINAPVIAIVLNVLRQLVRVLETFKVGLQTHNGVQVIPKKATDPPEVFHWIPIVGSAIQYGNDPLNFFFKCREKVGHNPHWHWKWSLTWRNFSTAMFSLSFCSVDVSRLPWVPRATTLFSVANPSYLMPRMPTLCVPPFI